MNRLHIIRFGFGCGMTGAIFYIGCIILMALADQNTSIVFFNSLMHGVNVEPILRMDVPPLEAIMGLISIFILGWFAGALVAVFYNVSGSGFRK